MASYLGYKSPYFSGVINGKEELSPAFLKRISEKLNVNDVWVLSDEGEMMRDMPSQPEKLLTAKDALKEAEEKALNTGKVVPLYEDTAVVAGVGYDVEMVPPRTVSTIDVGSMLKDSEAAIRVYGNSMVPNYPAGCVIGTKLHIDSFIEPGRVYVIETRGGRYIKRLYYNDDKSCFQCVSDNHMIYEEGPRRGKPCYPDFEVPLNEVIRLHKVVGVIKRNIL